MEPRPYEGLEERGEAGGDRSSGTSGTPSPTGRVRVFTLVGMSCTVLVYGIAKTYGPQESIGVGVPHAVN